MLYTFDSLLPSLHYNQVSFPTGSAAGTYPRSLIQLLHAPCMSCHVNHCRGCFKPLSCPPSCDGRPSGATKLNLPCTVQTCCQQVRAIALFEVLCTFDQEVIREKRVTEDRIINRAAKAKAKAWNKSVGPGGTGYTQGGFFRRAASISVSTAQVKHAMQFDQFLTRALAVVALILPSASDSGSLNMSWDQSSHPSILPLFTLSQLPTLLGVLLRNDSLGNWLERSDVYHAVLGLLRRLADTEVGMIVLTCTFSDRKGESRDVSLAQWMWDDTPIEWDGGGGTRGKPLSEYLRTVTKQCDAFSKGAERMVGDDIGGRRRMPGDVGTNLMAARKLCHDITTTSADVERGMERFRQALATSLIDKGKSGDGKPEASAYAPGAYEAAHSRLSFAYVSLEPYVSHHYHLKLAATQNSTRRPADRFHLMKELGVMSTSLPEGIWVRVDEVRFDVLSVSLSKYPLCSPLIADVV
jgi:hypothetical protein